MAFFCWLSGDSIDWQLGALLFLLGAAGGLATVYFAIGSDLPMFGSALLERELRGEVEVYKAEVDRLLGARTKEAIEAPDGHVGRLQEELRARESTLAHLQRRNLAIGLVLYPVLGGFFAAGAATSWVQAVIIGAGWTGLASAVGIKRVEADAQGKREQRDLALAEASRTEAAAASTTGDTKTAEVSAAAKAEIASMQERLLQEQKRFETLAATFKAYAEGESSRSGTTTQPDAAQEDDR